ncbi:hypothetical protein BD779DRAFT_529972 [Infundibulicybe gibba]|nr:hypothetical protein BD779DRAFT_529972 [Infundibulicybe gibba]
MLGKVLESSDAGRLDNIMPSAISLPPDIWSHIFTYIPSEAFKVIGSVNRQFYAAAVKARFRRAVVSGYSNWEHELKPLLDPSTARNVKSFCIDAHSLKSSNRASTYPT